MYVRHAHRRSKNGNFGTPYDMQGIYERVIEVQAFVFAPLPIDNKHRPSAVGLRNQECRVDFAAEQDRNRRDIHRQKRRTDAPHLDLMMSVRFSSSTEFKISSKSATAPGFIR